MRRKATAHDVQVARRDWYVYHFENRQAAKTLTESERQSCLTICAAASPPQMSVFGGTVFDHLTPQAYKLADERGIDANLLNPWYLSDTGWDDFQRLWRALPEPVDLSTRGCVQIGELSTLSTVDEIEKP